MSGSIDSLFPVDEIDVPAQLSSIWLESPFQANSASRSSRYANGNFGSILMKKSVFRTTHIVICGNAIFARCYVKSKAGSPLLRELLPPEFVEISVEIAIVFRPENAFNFPE